MLTRRRAARADDALLRRRLEQAIRFREAWGSTRPPAGWSTARRPAAVADRRSLRRLPGGAGAVAGHGRLMPRDHRAAGGALRLPASSPATIRGCGCSRGSNRRSRSSTATCRRRSRSGRARRATWSTRSTGRRPGCSSISARTAWPPRTTRRGRLLDAFSYNGGFALALAPPLRRGHRRRHLRGRGRADPAQRRARTDSPTSRRAR